MASVRYGDGSTCDIPFARLRAADFAESLPWRRVRSVHGMLHHSGEYASASTGGQVVYESRLELVWLLLADCDPAVVNIFAQPCRVVARVDGRVRSHVPDFLLVMRSGTVRVVNVKSAERAQDPTIAEALAWPGRLVERHGWEYEVWTGADPVLLENVRFLAGYRHPGIVPAGEIERAWREVVDGEELAVAERQLAGGGPREVARPPPPARTTASSPGSRHEHLDAGQDPDRPRAAARRSPGQLDQQLRALRTTNRGFLHHIGLPAARVDPMLLGLTTPETQALHKATGVPAEVLRAMTLDSYDTFAVNIAPGRRQLERPPAWAFRSSRTRYCPACLHENGGRGLLLWRLPWASHAPNTSCSWPTSVPPAPARPTRGRSASRGPATSASAHATDSTTQPRAAGALVPPTCSTPRRSPFPPMIWS